MALLFNQTGCCALALDSPNEASKGARPYPGDSGDFDIMGRHWELLQKLPR